MPDVEKVIKELECCVLRDPDDSRRCAECPKSEYGRTISNSCINGLMVAALALLKAQEPHVMTLGDLRDIGSVWELNTPPYLWMEINPAYRWTRGFWVAWREIYDMIDGLNPTYDADNYGSIWRCWTSRPTDEQREKVKWDD